MLWLNARSLIALGMTTATRNGSAGGGASVAAGASVGAGAGASVAVGCGAHAPATITMVRNNVVSQTSFFMFFSLKMVTKWSIFSFNVLIQDFQHTSLWISLAFKRPCQCGWGAYS